jgi:hypothetical protein
MRDETFGVVSNGVVANGTNGNGGHHHHPVGSHGGEPGGGGTVPVLRNGVNLLLDVRYWGMESVQHFVKIHGEDRMAHLLKVRFQGIVLRY